MHADSLFLKLYNLLWRLALPLLRRNKRLQEGFAERCQPQFPPADIWIQAASGGEAYLVRELLSALSLSAPGFRILCSTWTRQGRTVLEAISQTNPRFELLCAWMPFDTLSAMRQALQQARPRLVVLLETELWPSLLAACAECSVPVLVLNARMTPKSARSYALLKKISPAFWQHVAPAHVAAISPDDAQRFARLFDLSPASDVLSPRSVSVMPNIKFDRALHTLMEARQQPATLHELFKTAAPVILLASVRSAEERILLPLIRALIAQCPQARIIIAPRHMHRIKKWQAQLPDAPCASQLFESPAPASPGVLLWDRFGELNQLYAHAHAVFVGGSLAPLGGQNFLEALTMGKIPCVGPSLDNFAWALPGLPEAQLIHICTDVNALQRQLLQNLQNCPPPEDVQSRFQDWLLQHQGGAARAASIIMEVA